MAYQPNIYGFISTLNSTSANLAANGVFTGTAEDVSGYSNIKVNIFTSHVSATDGLTLQQSADGITWLSPNGDAYTVPATTLKVYSIGVGMRFFRVVYTNGGTLTTSLIIQTIYHTSDKQPSSVRPQDGRSNENDFTEILSFLMGYNGVTNVWDRIRQTSGALWTTEPSVLFKGRSSSFRTPGRAGTAGQKILSIFNAVGSPVTITIKRVYCDLYQTVIKAVTVAPPIIRVYKVTTAPTNGTVLTKNKIGGTTTSNAAVAVLGDASADGTGSATTLTIALTAGTHITQEFSPRLITAAGYEPSDRLEFFGDTQVEFGPGEGAVLMLDYTLATQNPTTDQWISGFDWFEK